MFSFFKRKKKDTPEQPGAIATSVEHAEAAPLAEPKQPPGASAGQSWTPNDHLTHSDPGTQQADASFADQANSSVSALHEEALQVNDAFEPAASNFPVTSAHETYESDAETPEVRRGWFSRLTAGLKKTGQSITQVFTGAQIDDNLYEELEAALLMADAGTAATQYLLDDLRTRVKASKTTNPAAVRGLLEDALTELLTPLESALHIGEQQPTVIMVSGVNGAGKTTTIGKLTRHLALTGCKVLLAAGDTFRAAAREQLAVWADRNTVEVIAQQGGDPASVSFDAVAAGRARNVDVVLVDTAGRLATQLNLMDELKKIRRVIGKAMEGAPHEVLLVVDGNTGQNALAQVKAFDAAINLTGLVVTKLDGTAKGGVIAAIALWSAERQKSQGAGVPVYFIGVGEQVEDLQTFNAREFAQALLGS